MSPIGELNKNLRKALRTNKFNAVGWTFVYIGSVGALSCKRPAADISVAEAIFARKFIESSMDHLPRQNTMSSNDSFGVLFNWYH